MTERIYQHRTAAEHYLQAAQVHATLATARIEPTFDSVRGPASVSEHSISRFRGEMETLGLNPDEWELDDTEKRQG